MMGDTDFFQALRNYLDDPDIAFGYATTPQLKAHLEQQSGLDLSEFFDDWYIGEGYPSYQINWISLDEKINLEIFQTTSHASVDFFEMPLPIQCIGADNDTIIRLDHLSNGQQFSIDVGFDVNEIVFDPDLWILSKGNTIDFVTGTSNTEKVSNISVYPNPTVDFVHLLIDNQEKSKEYKIIDTHGKIIKQGINQPKSPIDLRILDGGIYFIEVISESKTLLGKIVKSH
jgi:hypothetical protein